LRNPQPKTLTSELLTRERAELILQSGLKQPPPKCRVRSRPQVLVCGVNIAIRRPLNPREARINLFVRQVVKPLENCALGYVGGRGAKNYLHRVTGRRSRNRRKKRGLRILSIVLPLVRYQHVNSEATTGIFSTSDKLNRPAVVQLDSLFAAPPTIGRASCS